MGTTTIQWTWRRLPDGTCIKGYTYNPWWGCVKVAPECTHCYAEGIAHHYHKEVWGPEATTPRWTFGEKHWQEPLAWNRQAEKQGHRRSVFCASMADVFEEHRDVVSERLKLWKLIEQTPWLNWLLLTKRPQNILKMSPWGNTWLDNVWWVICGGESGPEARPFDLAWARDLRDQCKAAGVLYFFKQVGGRYHDSGGRLLDGRTWDEMPAEQPPHNFFATT